MTTATGKLVLAIQFSSVFMTVVIYVGQLGAGLAEEQVLAIGGNMTMALLVLMIVNHYRAGKGLVSPALLALPGIMGPGYALMSGPVRHVISYHGAVLVMHFLVLWRLAKYQAKQASQADPDQEGPA